MGNQFIVFLNSVNVSILYGLFVLCVVAKGTYHVWHNTFDLKRIINHLWWLVIGSIIYILIVLGNMPITGL